MFGLCQALETWESYCARNNFDSSRADYRKAYCLRRINGSILDMARSADHLTRSDRKKAKAIREADPADRLTDDELAAATGIGLAEVRRVQAQAIMPTSLDGHDGPDGAEYAGIAVADPGASVESQAVASGMLGAFLEAYRQLDAESRVVLALCYHRELDFKVIAKELRTSEERVRELHDRSVCEVHAAMLRSVQLGPIKSPAPSPGTGLFLLRLRLSLGGP